MLHARGLKRDLLVGLISGRGDFGRPGRRGGGVFGGKSGALSERDRFADLAARVGNGSAARIRTCLHVEGSWPARNAYTC